MLIQFSGSRNNKVNWRGKTTLDKVKKATITKIPELKKAIGAGSGAKSKMLGAA
jgi:hypothetical protein